MKTRWITAAIAASLLLPFFGVAAYAAPVDERPLPDGMAEIETVIEDALVEGLGLPEVSQDMKEEGPEPTTGGLEDLTELPAPPPGTGTVIDYSTDTDGTLFYTIITPDEHVFYLVIEKNRNIDNVYFLNAVTIDDLLPLAQKPPQAQGAMTVTPPTTAIGTEQPVENPPAPEPDKPQGRNMGTLIFVVVIVVLGGGARWYFKIYRPKQQGTADADEYDPSMDVAGNDYADDWSSGKNEADNDSAWGDSVDNGDDPE